MLPSSQSGIQKQKCAWVRLRLPATNRDPPYRNRSVDTLAHVNTNALPG
jgi:hypothetical protein